jgi:hypothetical protein
MPIGIIAVAWVTFIVVLLLFPPAQSVTAQDMSWCLPSLHNPLADFCLTDYAVVIIMAVFIFASVSWVFSAHKWFKGPVKTVDEDVVSRFDIKEQS